MKDYINLKNTNLEFKNLISAPAQVGRILNYVIYTGKGLLKHKPGSRNDDYKNNIGNAWCIEFMIGLNLIELSTKVSNENLYYLKLTEQGSKLYNALLEKNINSEFDHNSNPNGVLKLLKEKDALNIVDIYESIFRNTIIFKNLCIFLDLKNENKEEIVIDRKEFIENYYKELYEFYTKTEYIRNGNGASTAGNRVPSLIQTLSFLNYIIDKNGKIHFKVKALKEVKVEDKIDISNENFINEIKKEEEILLELEKKYGLAGNRRVNTNVRLSETQFIFKERLQREHGSYCWLCGLENSSLLIASHIKDAAVSNIHQKADNDNGLLLCAQHDKLFDNKLISFNSQNGMIMISKTLSEKDRKLSNINENMKLDEKLMNKRRKAYLNWHNKEFID